MMTTEQYHDGALALLKASRTTSDTVDCSALIAEAAVFAELAKTAERVEVALLREGPSADMSEFHQGIHTWMMSPREAEAILDALQDRGGVHEVPGMLRFERRTDGGLKVSLA